MPAIVVENLTKSYTGKRVVDGISFQVAEGEVFGLLGPNGAGKTTTVEILEGLRTADSGVTTILGINMATGGGDARQRIGIAPQSTALMPYLTCYETLDLFASFYKHALKPDDLLDRLGLTEKRNARVTTLSGGQQQRLSVAIALINDAQVVFLDEPTTGLDPQARRSMWDVVLAMRQEGRTVLLTTHYMEEAERLSDRIAILDSGRILAIDTPDRLITTYFAETAIQTTIPAVQQGEFEGITGVVRMTAEGEIVTFYTTSSAASLSDLLQRATQKGLELNDVHVRRGTLEDVFLKLTGKRIRE
jgi:ABC-2 type transport system ATP-binding protein